MIERHWRGIAKTRHADDYLKHLTGETFPALRTIDGFVGASILKRPVDAGMEFLVITRWNSLEAIAKFAGENIASAVVPDIVKQMMVAFDSVVIHYDLVDA